MVQSSYKNRKKNRKQSFKRKNTDGNRKVKFIEDDDDKMVGGNQTTITNFINKYKDHPIFGVLLAIYSNQNCAVENEDGTCKVVNRLNIKPAYKKSKEIMEKLPDVPDKPKRLTVEQEKESDSKKGTVQEHKVNYVGEVIDYLAQNVFIPKTIIHKVHVQNDSDDWKTLKNKNFKGITSAVTNTKTREEMKEVGAKKTRKLLETEEEDEDIVTEDMSGRQSAVISQQPQIPNTHKEGERVGPSFENDIKQKSDITNRASAGASAKVGSSSATIGPNQKVGMDRVQELMLQINNIATKKTGRVDGDVKDMKDLLLDLRALIATILGDISDSDDDKPTLETLKTKLDGLSDINDFARFSDGWVKAVSFFTGFKQNQ